MANRHRWTDGNWNFLPFILLILIRHVSISAADTYLFVSAFIVCQVLYWHAIPYSPALYSRSNSAIKCDDNSSARVEGNVSAFVYTF